MSEDNTKQLRTTKKGKYPYFIEYEKIYRLGHFENEGVLFGEYLVQEKFHGSNIRFMRRGDKVLWGTHHVNMSTSNFAIHAKTLVEKMMEFVPENWILMGEYVGGDYKPFGSRFIQYDFERSVLIYDVYDTNLMKYLHPIKWIDTLKALGFKVVEFIQPTGMTTKFFDDLMNKIGEKGHEGLVVKNYNKQLFAKLRTNKFREHDNKVRKVQPQKKKYPNEFMFLDSNITRNRVEHVIQGMIEEDEWEWSMKMMPKLFKKVYLDAIKEEFTQFYLQADFREFNFGQAKKRTGHLVAKILNELLQERGLKK
jgi:ATP-dependent RNA circularization protein (DNA/RNA ligase family)